MKTNKSRYPTYLILFDGDCSLCNASMRFIVKNEKGNDLYFASLQSSIGREAMDYYQLKNDLASIVFVENGAAYTKSTAILRISRKLKGLWPLLYIFIILPATPRDYCYRIIAENRYRWFGKHISCQLPPPALRKRILS